jgi:integrase
MKMAKEHRVPLAEPAIELLRNLYTEKGNDAVFIGQHEGRGLGDRALAEVLVRWGAPTLQCTASVAASATGPLRSAISPITLLSRH